jgi:hypothetical protein
MIDVVYFGYGLAFVLTAWVLGAMINAILRLVGRGF